MISLMSSSYKLLKNIVYFLAFNSCLYNPFTSLVSFVITYNQKRSNKLIVFFGENESIFSNGLLFPPWYDYGLIYAICCMIKILPHFCERKECLVELYLIHWYLHGYSFDYTSPVVKDCLYLTYGENRASLYKDYKCS